MNVLPRRRDVDIVRGCVRHGLLILVSLSAWLAASCGAPGRPDGVVLIIVDTLRADHLGPYGYGKPTTPHLDGWAATGSVFDRAFSTSPWTLPAIASLFTGQVPSTHLAGLLPDQHSTDDLEAFWQRTPLSDDAPTLASRLGGAGVTTAAFASNPYLRERFGLSRGFDIFENGKWSGPEALDAALQWLEGVEGPYFLAVHLMEPHIPYEPPESARGRFTDGNPQGEPVADAQWIRDRLGLLSDRQWEFIRGRYDEEVLATDRLVEELRQGLERQGLLDTSLVILVSDHGEEFMDHDGYEHGHAMFQEIVRVPLIVWGPGVSAGREDAVVSLVDIAPTVLEAMDVSTQGFSPGRSFWPLLRSGEPPPPRPLLIENTLYGPERKSLIEWPMKLTVDWTTGEKSLFDLETDPGERRDLISEQPELADRMLADLERQVELAESRAGEPSQPVELTPELERELRALGYIQ